MFYRVTCFDDEPTKKLIEELLYSEGQKGTTWSPAVHVAKSKITNISVITISESIARKLKDLRYIVPNIRFVIFNRLLLSQPWAIWTEGHKKSLPHDARTLYPNKVNGASFLPPPKIKGDPK